MSLVSLYSVSGVALFCLGLFAVVFRPHLLQKIMAINVAGSGVFLVYVALAHGEAPPADPVPHAMVLTGIVVAVSTTALALVLALALQRRSGRMGLPDDGDRG